MADEKINETTRYIITAIIAILAGAGVSTLDGVPDALENWYICDTSLETGEFVRLSGTEYTGYPHELDNKAYKRCIDEADNKGTWQPILEYAEANGINIEDLIPEDSEQTPDDPGTVEPGVKQEVCSTAGCVPI